MRAACLWAVALAGCSSVSSLDAPRRPLAAGEPQTVRAKSDEALSGKDYALAWNHEFHAGADRARLEAIFLAALAADAGAADDMFEQLGKAHGGLSPQAQARVKEIAGQAEAEGDWVAAAGVHLLAAADPPEYSAAWDVYRRAPPKQALSILEDIQDARKEHAEAGTPKGP
jgi:hypothetical protein